MLCKRYLIKSCIRPRIYSCYCTTAKLWPDKIFSGIQPTGVLHIGNYFGAVRNWINLQNTCGNVMCSIVDLHSTTLPNDNRPEKLPTNILLMTACLLGCGINPEKSVLFLQSEVPEHTQLCWFLGCLTTTARLSRLPQFQEKSASEKNVSLGLFSYPVLQAADILVHQATRVPVGKDQVQHLQLASHLAWKFNTIYGDTFPVPLAIINNDQSAKIRNLRNPTKKMSKSFPDPKSRIEITDSSDMIREKIKKAVTDCRSVVTFEPDTRPGVSNLVTIHSLLTGRHVTDLCYEARNIDTGKYKLVVADVIVETLRPIREEIDRLYKDKAFLVSILEDGAKSASESASKTWKLVRERVGLHPYV